jgi:hypothetical protein
MWLFVVQIVGVENEEKGDVNICGQDGVPVAWTCQICSRGLRVRSFGDPETPSGVKIVKLFTQFLRAQLAVSQVINVSIALVAAKTKQRDVCA